MTQTYIRDVSKHAGEEITIKGWLYNVRSSGQDSDSFWVRLRSTQLLLPVLVLAVFAGLTGFVNYERWGHPLVFADYQVYLINIDYPDWPLRAAAYGLFNVARIPFGIVYYFFPIWVINRSDGRPLFDELQTRLLDSTELPPASFLLTDALLLALMVYALWSVAVLRHQLPVIRSRAITIGAGLSAPCLLMLCAISMNHRYRIDFYPFIEFGAFLGVIFMLKSERLRSVVAGRAALLGAALSIGGSHVVLVLYKLSSFGPAIEHMRHGFFDYYLHQLMSHYPLLARWIPT